MGNTTRREYTGRETMAETAVGGPLPDEHQSGDAPYRQPADPTPSEERIPSSGSGYVAPDVGATSPGSGTSQSGAGGTAATSGTMTQGTWGVTPRPKQENEASPTKGP